MNFREEAVVDLRVNDSEATTKWVENKERIKEIKDELAKLKQAGEQGSEGYKALQRELRGLQNDQKGLIHDIDLSKASIDQMQAALSYWTREAKKAEQGSAEMVKAASMIAQIKPVLNEATAELRGLGVEVEKQPGFWTNFKTSALSVFTGMGLFELVKGAGAAMLDFGKEIFATTAKFEKYETVLRVALGTQEAAEQAMGKIKTMAAQTPFSVDELTESYVKYVNRGLQPSMAEMTKLGDIAASQGKSFDQLTEAVLDAGTGEFERLKEFGIQASKSGNEVELSFKGVQKTVANTPEAIQGALIAFGELEGVQGGMAAISQTLEGRVSNLGDMFDNLKLVLGDALMPVFVFLLDLFQTGITFITDLVSGNVKLAESSTFLGGIIDGLGNVFSAIWDVLKSLFNVTVSVIGSFASMFESSQTLSNGTSYLQIVLNVLAGALRLIGSVAILALTGIQALVDGFNIIINKGKEVANFFGAEFKIDSTATFENLKKNAENNLNEIANLWSDSAKKGADVQKTANNDVTENAKKAGETQTANDKAEKEKQRKEAEKLAKDKQKAEEDLIKKVEDMNIKAIADDTQRAIAKADLDYKREQESIRKSQAAQATKDKALQAAEKQHTAAIEKINDDARKKEEKEQAAAAKKAEAEKKKTEAEVKKQKDQALKDTKALLDDEFRAEIAKARISLELARTNSQAQWDAKRQILEAEAAYRAEKLRNEAAEEKARIEESIADEETKAARIKAIDERLAQELTLNDAKLQNDKKQQQKDANAEREKNNAEFYEGLNAAMTGDFNAFTDFLKKKALNDGKHLNERTVAFAKHAEEVGGLLTTGINMLMKLNADYTERQLNNLKREKDENFKKLDEEYAKGTITKEQLEAEKIRLQAKFDAEALELKKKEFERNKKMQIANALIAGSLAVLNALATPPWFVGLGLAIAAGIKTAIDINNIRNQKFEGRKGGILRNKNAFIAKGSAHGQKYGDAGIVMYDRLTGAEVGEIEGGEPVMVLSKQTMANNGPVIHKLLDSSLNKNGAPITLASGGVVHLGKTRMFQDGGVYSDYTTGASTEYVDPAGTGASEQLIEENRRIQEDMRGYAEKTAKNTAELVNVVSEHTTLLRGILNKDNGAGQILHAIERQQANASKSNF